MTYLPPLEELDRDGAVQEAAAQVDGDTRAAFLRKAGLGAGAVLGGGALFGAVPGLASAAGRASAAAERASMGDSPSTRTLFWCGRCSPSVCVKWPASRRVPGARPLYALPGRVPRRLAPVARPSSSVRRNTALQRPSA